MRTVAFDIGGVLRPVYISGANTVRNFAALRVLYRTFCYDPNWYVVITTKRPPGKDTLESVRDELEARALPAPDEVLICHGSKTELFKQATPDLVVDDCDEHIKEAQALGITTLKVD